MDDVTVARFEQATGAKVPGSGSARFAQRARWLLADENRHVWLAWRAGEVSHFYQRVGQELVAARADARLYLAGANMFDGEEIRRELQPSLPQRSTLAEAMLHVGIDASLLDNGRRDGRVVLLRPEQIIPRWSLASQAVGLVLRQLDDADRYFKTVTSPGSVFFNKPQELRLASFDKQSPFTRSYTWLAAQVVPSDRQNRRRFIHSLASLDAQVMFDGGWQLPMGQESAVADLVAAYRRLPAVPFEPFINPSDGRPREETSRPVTVRSAVHDQHTYLYIANEAPLAATAKLQLACPNPCTLEELSGLRQVAEPTSGPLGTVWTVQLEAYDLLAVRFSSPAVKPLGVTVDWPDEVRKTLRARTADLLDRTASLLKPPLLDVLENPGFEQPLKDRGRIPGWAASRREGTSVSLESTLFHGGGKSLRIASSGPVTTLVSEPFAVPATGRLTMSVWLRTGNPANQPPLQLAVVGRHNGRDLFYFYQLGHGGSPELSQTAIGPEWQRVPVLFPLPLERLTQVQLRFDLLGPGEVWIDDVQLSALEFNEKERMALFKLIAPADMKLQQGQIGNCFDLLEGYWPRFLVTNVPAVEHRAQTRPSPPLPRRNAPQGTRRNRPPRRLEEPPPRMDAVLIAVRLSRICDNLSLLRKLVLCHNSVLGLADLRLCEHVTADSARTALLPTPIFSCDKALGATNLARRALRRAA